MKKGRSAKEKRRLIAPVCIAGAVFGAALLLLLYSKGQDRHRIFRGSTGKVIHREKEREDTLVIGVSSLSESIHPYRQEDEAMKVLLRLVYEPLLMGDGKGGIIYKNAGSVRFEEGGSRARVTVNTKKAFSDGTPVTAKRVLQSYEWFLGRDTAYTDCLRVLEKIEPVGEDTLVFTFREKSLDNIRVFFVPLIYQEDQESEYGSTALGTGPYKIESLVPYEKIILSQNGGGSYGRVELWRMDYSRMEEILEFQEMDLFMIDKGMYDMVTACGAYDIWETEKEQGYYLAYGLEDKSLRDGIAGLAAGKKFFEETQDKGIFSPGIVSAYKENPCYGTLVEKGSLEGADELSVLLEYDGGAAGIYQGLSQVLGQEGVSLRPVQSQEEISAPSGLPQAELVIYWGSYRDLLRAEDEEGFYESYPALEAERFYDSLERYLAKENFFTPLSRDTVWAARLAGRDTLGLLE